jgi:hypothetical protein
LISDGHDIGKLSLVPYLKLKYFNPNSHADLTTGSQWSFKPTGFF